jgi:ureidoglycolate hydrolase
MNQSILLRQLPAKLITVDGFKPYGQLIKPSPDGKTFDDTDAQLKLNNGTPRFYIMRLQRRGRKFHTITRHLFCTQCLGSLNGREWFMAFCPPNEALEPDLSQIKAFRIPGDCFVKLEAGTWHAGPYFEEEVIDFYNLELRDTNIVDHFTHNFLTKQNLEFEIIDAP